MRISELVFTPVAIPLRRPLLHAWGCHPAFGRIVVEVRTDEGLRGLGECSLTPGRAMEETLRFCRTQILGEDPFQLERIRAKIAVPFYVRLFGSLLTLAYAAIEFACLDIQGKATGRPVADLLGGRLRERIPLTAYVFYPRLGDPTSWEEAQEAVVAEAEELVEGRGLGAIKLKAGVFPPEAEVETIRALRRRFPSIPIRMDPNSVWSVATSVRVGRLLQDAGLEYLEDPTWGLRGMAQVKKMLPYLPLASNMALFGYDDIAPAAFMDAVDVLLADPHWYGGLVATKAVARVCEALSFDMGMHSGVELGVSLAALLHLCASLPNLSHFPDVHYHYLPDDVIRGGPLAYVHGCLPVPSGPGLGVELDEEKVGRYHELYESAMASEEIREQAMRELFLAPPLEAGGKLVGAVETGGLYVKPRW